MSGVTAYGRVDTIAALQRAVEAAQREVRVRAGDVAVSLLARIDSDSGSAVDALSIDGVDVWRVRWTPTGGVEEWLSPPPLRIGGGW